ncbi:MAG: translation initiation factor IF-2 subunit alpha [Candidatus Thermoplasmatota archaeon]|nr:translation initiation factor IF-2 subunit alpha [Candidatus Thermoplasmatota archaeon]
MAPRENLPEEGELIVCTVTNVKNFGAFVSLDEYPNVEGFIHIAEVATGWVKYIRNYIREGQKTVCKVMKAYPGKGTVDLSLKQVNEHQRRDKIREWKNETRARKLLGIVGQKIGKDEKWCMETFSQELEATYGNLYGAFEQCAIDRNSLREDGFKGEWTDAFVEVAVDNIIPPFVHIAGSVEVISPLPDGIKHINHALASAENFEKEEGEILKIEVRSLGTPRYAIRVTAEDYKVAEEELKKAADRVHDAMGSNGNVEFKRKE